mmetsp:Transcript_4582/g.13853  ORF Transcript_4582/g.13853 Transcript_4582/m.13853 type:complete len:495 (+) Transcript_4582:121-1605(+)
MMTAAAATLSAIFHVVAAAPAADKVDVLPGFQPTNFSVYSGYLLVPGPFEQNSYDSLSIHYQFHESMNNPKTDPIATWHQGGPGGSSIDVGLYTEMGFFQVDNQGTHTNPYSWNTVSSMLYLESPAGSGSESGFSSCIQGGKPVDCYWNDTSQAEAYAHTLAAFFGAFPEFASNDLYITGESYAGQYVPNIAHFILNNEPFKTKLNLKGIALGNACWGGNATHVQCNGENAAQHMAEIYHGKGLSSEANYADIQAKCQFPDISDDCESALRTQSEQVGPHNIYNIYDNCPRMREFTEASGATMYDIRQALEAELNTGVPAVQTLERKLGHPAGTLGYPSGGYPWACGGMDDVRTWLQQPAVMKALHVSNPGASGFHYHSSGPASITLHPELATKLRVLIYNGDADACVPYRGNEEWIADLVSDGDLSVSEDWRPWYNDVWPGTPAGYVTAYKVAAAPNNDFHFLTIRLAGHMVPTFQPASSISFFSRFLQGKPF